MNKGTVTLFGYSAFIHIYGGSAWESNPPDEGLARHTGFEVREPHQ